MKRRNFSAASCALATLLILTPASLLAAPPEATASIIPESAQLSQGSWDVLKLTKAKVNDDVTVAFIRNSDRRFSPSAAEIVRLREAGVSDRVLTAMLEYQPGAAPVAPPAPEVVAPPVAAAPQYVETPALTTEPETAPSSVLYIGASTPSYYSFSDPWPYYYSSWWYNPWPYYYWSSWWYYPYYSCGWYWNDCHNNNGHWGDCDNNGHHDNNHWDSQKGNRSGRNADDMAAGRTPPARGSTEGGVASATRANGTRPSGNTQLADRTGARTDAAQLSRSTSAIRTAGENPVASPDSQRAGAGQPNRPVASRTPVNQTTATTTAAGVSARTTRTWVEGANTRTVASRPSPDSSSVSPASTPGTRSTSTWTGNGQAAARPVASSGTVTVPRSARPASSSASTLTRIGGQPATRYSSSPTSSYSRSSVVSVGRSYSAGSGGAGYSRPSMSAPSRSMGSTSSFRGGSSGYSGGGAARPSMSGGGGRSR